MREEYITEEKKKGNKEVYKMSKIDMLPPPRKEEALSYIDK